MECSLLYICFVNLWVGIKIKLCGFLVEKVLVFKDLCSIGSMNVNVLFEFVLDEVNKLCFVIVSGIVCCWILVVCLKL